MINQIQEQNIRIKISIFVISFSLIPFICFAARLYLEPSQGEYYQNDTFLIDVLLDTEGKSINAVEVNLSFPKNILEIQDFSQGNSILNIWLKSPEFSNQDGRLSFSGGIPGGYRGESGLLGKIVFQAKEQQIKTEVSFSGQNQVLINDGKGTEAPLTTNGAVFEILKASGAVLNEWQQEIEKDKTLPSSFKIVIDKNDNIFQGKYFAVFSTTDKESGIDRYEIKEGGGDWETIQSPYLLKDQSLSSKIQVKAIDKAGNERIESYIEEGMSSTVKIILGFVSVIVIYYLIKKYLLKKE